MGPDPKLVLLVAIFAFFSFYIMNSPCFLLNDGSAEINEIQMRMIRCVLGACPDVASAIYVKDCAISRLSNSREWSTLDEQILNAFF